jgi:hypothetical protein
MTDKKSTKSAAQIAAARRALANMSAADRQAGAQKSIESRLINSAAREADQATDLHEIIFYCAHILDCGHARKEDAARDIIRKCMDEICLRNQEERDGIVRIVESDID